MKNEKLRIKIKRQDNPGAQPYWEDFEIVEKQDMNVISVLQELQRNPVNNKGEKVTPVVWECNCLEEVCGACSMVINGRVRQACSSLIKQLERPLILEPMSKFPIIRDLKVNRTRMFQGLIKVKGWIPIDGTYDLGAGPRMSATDQIWAYALSRCMTCGCCFEACPQVNDKSDFIGPAIIAQVAYFNTHPTGKMNRDERLDAVMGVGGVTDCGNAQNCVQVCPKEVPLTTAIAEVNRQTTLLMLKRIFWK